MATSESEESKAPENTDSTKEGIDSGEAGKSAGSGDGAPGEVCAKARDSSASPGDSPQASKDISLELTESQQLHQHHVSKILDEVLEEPENELSGRTIKHPMLLDIVLAISLLVAMGGFTAGLFKMYIAHSAQQYIMQRNYKGAIAVLRGAPLPGFVSIPGGGADSDPQELLNQALYLDGIEKLDTHSDVNGGLAELQQILPGSRYFNLAQEAINENFEPSSTFLQSGIEHQETNPQEEKKPFNPELPPENN